MADRHDLEQIFETALFRSRWLMAAFYAGLIFGLAVLLATFAARDRRRDHASRRSARDRRRRLLLSLIDMSLAGNLTLMVVFAGYENFVSKLDLGSHPDKPAWMGKVDFSNMKLKLVASIIAISVIHLLKAFMSIGAANKDDLRWMIILHFVFLASGVLLALMDWLGERGAENKNL